MLGYLTSNLNREKWEKRKIYISLFNLQLFKSQYFNMLWFLYSNLSKYRRKKTKIGKLVILTTNVGNWGYYGMSYVSYKTMSYKTMSYYGMSQTMASHDSMADKASAGTSCQHGESYYSL